MPCSPQNPPPLRTIAWILCGMLALAMSGCGANEKGANECFFNSECPEGFFCDGGSCQAIDDNDDPDPDTGNGPEGEPECVPSQEVCDGVDNDCDEAVDEDDDPGLLDACAQIPGASPTACAAAACAFACDEGFVDIDGDLTQGPDGDGCECQIDSPAQEVCDGRDNDCDSAIDEVDEDLDLTAGCAPRANAEAVACAQAVCIYACREGFSDDNGDLGSPQGDGCERTCDDTELRCDEIDDDCNGAVDEGCDDDDDGFCDAALGNNGVPPLICPFGFNDCDDDNADIRPDAIEICDDIDNNCTDGPDEGCDDDGDGFCDVAIPHADTLLQVCPLGFDDCDDEDADIRPDAIEICDDIDNNCADGLDEGCDDDDDGFCDAALGNNGVPPLICPFGLGDCDDEDADIRPDAIEICDDIDNNCADGIDNGCDDDDDGFCDIALGNNGAPPLICLFGLGDCDDDNADIRPNAQEICDDIDNNCADGLDEGCDDDNDGFCDAVLPHADALPQICPLGFDDCDDGNADIRPNAIEICDDIDNNCTDGPDEGCDDDGDGFCDVAIPHADTLLQACPLGFDDCDDEDADIRPDAIEICDDIDNNCADGIDDGCDDDDDGFCDIALDNNGVPPLICPFGLGDCDDEDAAIRPNAQEICDDIDNNCAAGLDEGCDDDDDGFCDAAIPHADAFPQICLLGFNDCDDEDAAIRPNAIEICDDIDNNCANGLDEGCDDDDDGFCDVAIPHADALPEICPLGFNDCDDEEPQAFPGNTEICDGFDNDCNNRIDAADSNYADLCPLQDGVCAGSLTPCQGGRPLECDEALYLTHDPAFRDDLVFGEVLCDGLDNNCDGAEDEVCDISDCEGLGIERVSAPVDVIHPAIASNGEGLYAIAWVERISASEEGVFLSLFSVPEKRLVLPPVRLAGSNVTKDRWPSLVYDGRLDAFVIYHVSVPTTGRDTIFSHLLGLDGALSEKVAARDQSDNQTRFGPLDAITFGQGHGLGTVTFSLATGQTKAQFFFGQPLNLNNNNQLPHPAGGLAPSLEDGQANVSVAPHPTLGNLLFYAAEDRSATERAVNIAHDGNPGALDRQPTRLPNNSPGVTWPRIDKHATPGRTSAAFFRFLQSPTQNQILRVLYNNPLNLIPSESVLVSLNRDARPDNLQYLTSPDSERWMTIWRQGGQLKVLSTQRTFGVIFEEENRTIAPLLAPANTAVLAVDSRLQAGNLVITGRTQRRPGVDLFFINERGDRICPPSE